MPNLELMKAIYHELTHSVRARAGGFLLHSFLLENDGHGEYFGGSGIAYPPETPTEVAMDVAFAGPLGEIRFIGGKRQIDKSASFQDLLKANEGLATAVRFVGVDDPIYIQRGTFSDDWNWILGRFAQAVANGAEIDVPHLFSVLLNAAIDAVNGDEEWGIVDAVAPKIADLAVVQELAGGQEVNIAEQVNDLLGPHFDRPRKPS